MKNFFGNNLKRIREEKGWSQNELSKKTIIFCINHPELKEAGISPIKQSSITRWEAGENFPGIDSLVLLSYTLEVDINKLVSENIINNFNNQNQIGKDIIKIPVLRTIKTGIPLNDPENILEYVDIPKSWAKSGKKFYGLKVSGDSMYPKYLENDIVIFEQIEDYSYANKKDCAVIVNGNDATFKNVSISDNGITLVPLNPNNQDEYQATFYSKEEIEKIPVRIIGIAKEKRTRL